MLSMTHYLERMKYNIQRLEETDSTNKYLRELLPGETLPEFTVITTNFQSLGRGQRGNSWESERGMNLLFSVLLRPHFVTAKLQFVISQITSLAIKEGLDCFARGFSIKWPNDIYWNNQKICGILIENDLAGMNLSESILGIGININQDAFIGNAPNPVSLKNITGNSQDCEEILTNILHRLSGYYDLLQQGDTEIINGRYHDSLFRKDGFHCYSDKNGNFSAKIVRVEQDGRLILCTETGDERGYLFKEVHCIL